MRGRAACAERRAGRTALLARQRVQVSLKMLVQFVSFARISFRYREERVDSLIVGGD